MAVNKKSLENLSLIKKGEQRALKGDKPKSLRISGYVDSDLEEKALRLLEEHGTQTKLLNNLIRDAGNGL